MAKQGRPRSFDREEALRQAMEVFWSQGYDGASLSDLQAAMGGIAAPSLYAAFGSKDELFGEAIDLYGRTFGAALLDRLTDSRTAREGIEQMLNAALDVTCRRRGARGCLVVLAASHSSSATDEIRAELRSLQAARRKSIRDRLVRGQQDGDVPRGADLESVTAFYATFLDGLCHQARAGGSRTSIEAAIRAAMRAWPAVVGPKR